MFQKKKSRKEQEERKEPRQLVVSSSKIMSAQEVSTSCLPSSLPNHNRLPEEEERRQKTQSPSVRLGLYLPTTAHQHLTRQHCC